MPMAMLHLTAVAALSAASLLPAIAAQDSKPAAPATPQETSPASPDAKPDAKPAEAPAAAPVKPGESKPAALTIVNRGQSTFGKSPYATDNLFAKPPSVYVIPMDGQMGTDIHPVIYDRIIKDVKEKKPDLIVYRLKSSDGRGDAKYMERVMDAMRGDRVDPRRIATQVLEYRDLCMKLHEELAGYPTAMFVEDARGMASMYALAWPYMFMTPGGRISGLEIVGALAGGNDIDIRAKMFSAWTGIAKGVLEMGGRPQELSDALVRPDRTLSADIDGRSTKWRADTLGSWYVVDQSPDQSARFSAKTAEDTGLTEGLAEDVNDLMLLLGYPEYTTVDSGEKMFNDYKTNWHKRFEESEKWMEEFETPMEDERDLGKRKQILERMQALFKQYPPVARLWEWKRGLTEDQLKLLIEQLSEQIRAAQKAKQKGGSGGGGGGGMRGGGLGR